jgi:hypothetical protein
MTHMRPLLAATILLALTPAAANAATVSATYEHVPGYRGSSSTRANITVAAAPGERNAIRIARPGSGLPVITDAGAPLTAGAGCLATVSGITCPPPPGMDSSLESVVLVDAGDGDDTVSVDGTGYLSATIDGGPGDDVLTVVAPATASMRGGPGADKLIGGSVLDGGPGPDQLDGSLVTYADRTAPVYAAVGEGGGGEAGEGDVLGTHVGQIRGGHGDDTLIGNDENNELIGGEGDDHLDGRGGDDRLYGADEPGTATRPTADVLLGGEGSDLLDTGPDGRADGGPGTDRLTVVGDATAVGGSGADRLAISRGPGGVTGARVDTRDDDRDLVHCGPSARLRAEHLDARDVRFGCGPPPGHPAAGVVAITAFSANGQVFLTLVCPDTARKGCAVAARARIGRTPVGRNRIRLAAGEEHQLALPPGRLSAGRLLAEPGHTVRVTVTMRDQTGRLRATTRSACLYQVNHLVDDRPGAC